MTPQKLGKIDVEAIVRKRNLDVAHKQYDKISNDELANLVRNIAEEKNVYVLDMIASLVVPEVITAIKKEIKFQNF